MEIGIIGLPNGGKTTLFYALTGGRKEPSVAPSSSRPNLGVSKLLDPRLEGLGSMVKPKKTVPAEVRYIDIGGLPQGTSRAEEVRSQFLAPLSQVGVIMHVVRKFSDDKVPHPLGNINPQRDISAMEGELALSDLLVIERRMERIDSSLKGAKASDRVPLLREGALLDQVKGALEKDKPIGELALSAEEAKSLEGFQFLTVKPVLIALNIGEAQVEHVAAEEEELRRSYSRPRSEVVAVCAKLEAELAQFSPEEAQEFRAAMGLKESRTNRLVEASFRLLGLISFFTVVSGEVRSWTIPSGTIAHKAAGKIHSDMERGFIRAEVVGYEDLLRSGSLAEAKKKGLVRQEGKDYVVHDGDVVTFLFNV